MKTTLYYCDLTNYSIEDCDICGYCNAIFYDRNVSGLHDRWRYCPYCGGRFGTTESA